jgi:apolipoprotein N-acyltransferase
MSAAPLRDPDSASDFSWLRHAGIPLACGALCALGFAPVRWFIAPVISIAILFVLWANCRSHKAAVASGFAFGLGLFLAGASWVYVSLHVYGAMPAALAALATLLFCACLALFPSAAGWLVHCSARGPSFKLVVAAPSSFVLLEWLRSWLFTGFPWLTLGYTQAPESALSGYAPVLGVFGVSWLLAVSGGLVALVWVFRRDASWPLKAVALALLAAIWVGGLQLKRVSWSDPNGEPLAVALLQGNVAQDQKWREEVRAATLADYRRMALASEARLIIFPETALPLFFDQLPAAYLRELVLHARQRGGDILLGTVERTSAEGKFDYYNSVISLGSARPQVYRKSHLVPFGEFIPPGFGWVINILKIPFTDFARGEPGQSPLEAAGQRIAVNICYEDVFGDEIARQLPVATLLVNVSNDAWFGDSFAAEQHFQMSQMRALETSRWMLRATNTGVSGAIDEQGREVGRLAQFKNDTLVTTVQGRSGLTPYAATGNWPVLGALFACLLLSLSPASAFPGAELLRNEK